MTMLTTAPSRVAEVLEIADFRRIHGLMKPKRFQQALEKTTDRGRMIETVATFVEADAAATLNMVQAGEVYFRLISLPVEKLHAFLVEYASKVGVPEPKPLNHNGGKGRPISVGTKILADVVYAKHPEFLKRSGRSDTLAGKRVAACIRRYKKSAGLIKTAKPLPWPAKVPKSGRLLLGELFEVADVKATATLESLIKEAWGAGALSQLRRLAA